MNDITITLSRNEWEYIQGAVRQVADRKLGFIKNHPEGDGCEWYKNMNRTAKVLGNLADILAGAIARSELQEDEATEPMYIGLDGQVKDMEC